MSNPNNISKKEREMNNILTSLRAHETPEEIIASKQYKKIEALIEAANADTKLKKELSKKLANVNIKVQNTRKIMLQILLDTIAFKGMEESERHKRYEEITDFLMQDVVAKQKSLMDDIETKLSMATLTNKKKAEGVFAEISLEIKSFFKFISARIRKLDRAIRLAGNAFINWVQLKLAGGRFEAMTQSTHLRSVHKSVAKSAENLKEKYPDINYDEVLEEISEELKTIRINQTKHHDFYRKAILASFDRITSPNIKDWVEPRTGMTIPQVLALMWTTAKDIDPNSPTAKIDLEDRMALVGEFLWRAHLEYGLETLTKFKEEKPELLDESPEEALKRLAKPACLAGTFNKIVESLDQVHPLVQISRVTAPKKEAEGEEPQEKTVASIDLDTFNTLVLEKAQEFYDNLSLKNKELFLDALKKLQDIDHNEEQYNSTDKNKRDIIEIAQNFIREDGVRQLQETYPGQIIDDSKLIENTKLANLCWVHIKTEEPGAKKDVDLAVSHDEEVVKEPVQDKWLT